MKRTDFIEMCKVELTAGGTIPLYLGENEINRVIDSAKRFFSKSVQDAVARLQFVIKKDTFKNPDFKRNKTLKLPCEVQSVDGFKEIRGYSSYIGPDISPERMMASELYTMGINQSFDLVMMASTQSFYDISKSFMLDEISYSFNINTKELVVTGRTPRFDVLLSTWTNIAEEKLFDDYWFQRYVSCMLRKSQVNILGFFDGGPNLPGGQKLDIDRMESNANDELENILEKLKGLDPPNWFMLVH